MEKFKLSDIQFVIKFDEYNFPYWEIVTPDYKDYEEFRKLRSIFFDTMFGIITKYMAVMLHEVKNVPFEKVEFENNESSD